MSTGDNRALYLAWLRTAHPDVYVAALSRVANPNAGLSGLGDDATDIFGQSTSLDTGYVAPDVFVPPIDLPTVTTAGTNNSSFDFSTITNAVTSVGNAIVGAEAQSNLLAINTARAKQGLPPLNANGQPVTAAQLAPASSAVLQAEKLLSGSGGGIMLLVIGLVLAYLIFR